RSAGEMMVSEQREYHRSYPGVNPDAPSSSYILFENIQEWERALNVKVERNNVFYGLRRMVRPFLAWILGRRERASFSLLKITKR
ncbi:MAG TPA: hypothetical protein VFJ29_05625, partial [Candidatus Kapabacteria bacterium]|nr:hypothetical protein [Candidatus Kapabacteria bacterium]